MSISVVSVGQASGHSLGWTMCSASSSCAPGVCAEWRVCWHVACDMLGCGEVGLRWLVCCCQLFYGPVADLHRGVVDGDFGGLGVESWVRKLAGDLLVCEVAGLAPLGLLRCLVL